MQWRWWVVGVAVGEAWGKIRTSSIPQVLAATADVSQVQGEGAQLVSQRLPRLTVRSSPCLSPGGICIVVRAAVSLSDGDRFSVVLVCLAAETETCLRHTCQEFRSRAHLAWTRLSLPLSRKLQTTLVAMYVFVAILNF